MGNERTSQSAQRVPKPVNSYDGFSAEIDAITLTAVSYGYDSRADWREARQTVAPRAAARRAASPGGGRAVNHSRLNQVADAAHSAEYGYHPDSDILHTTTLKQGANTRLTTTRAHDDGNRLTSITSTLPNQTVASSHTYTVSVRRTPL